MASERTHWAVNSSNSAKPATRTSDLVSGCACINRFRHSLIASLPDRIDSGPKPRHGVVPVREQPIAHQVWYPQIDFQVELLQILQIGAPARGREDAVVEHDVAVDVAGEDNASQHQVGA